MNVEVFILSLLQWQVKYINKIIIPLKGTPLFLVRLFLGICQVQMRKSKRKRNCPNLCCKTTILETIVNVLYGFDSCYKNHGCYYIILFIHIKSLFWKEYLCCYDLPRLGFALHQETEVWFPWYCFQPLSK